MRGLITSVTLAAFVSACAGVRTEQRTARVTVQTTPEDARVEVREAKGEWRDLSSAERTLEGRYEVDFAEANPWSWALVPLTGGVLAGGVALTINEGTRGLGVTAAIMGTLWTIFSVINVANNYASDGDQVAVRPESMQLKASKEGFHPATSYVPFSPESPESLELALVPVPPRRPIAESREERREERSEERQAVLGTLQKGIGTLGVGGGGGGIGRGVGGLGGLGGRGARIGPGQNAVIAVFDIRDEARVLSARALRQATEYLRSRAASHGGFRVVPSDQLRKALGDTKQKSYASCFEESCQIELGRAVAAEKSLAPKVMRVGKRCSLSLILYDLKTETSERAATVPMPCNGDGLVQAIDQGL